MRAVAGLLLALALAGVPAVAGSPALAGGVVLTSTAPYWEVGPRDDGLSRACAVGRFGMRAPDSLVAEFTGASGAGVLGIAKGSGLNLYDPERRAKPEEDYFFRDHGTTSCTVFVGGRKPAPEAAAGASSSAPPSAGAAGSPPTGAAPGAPPR